jgi:bifunctional oligoribonuclease and PAP phosphatase NrnA
VKFSEIQKQIIDLIKRSEKILILPSTPVDGDAVGSALTMYLTLKKLNKSATVVCAEGVPDVLGFLPQTQSIGDKLLSSKDFIVTLDTHKIKVDEIKSNIEENKVNIIITPKEGRFTERDITFNEGMDEYDLIITVDTAELSQLRQIYEDNTQMFHEIPVINIDHHISNEHYGKVNYVDIMSASTTELLLPLLEKMEEEFEVELIDEDTATLLLAGIITDTGSFQNANTTPKAFAHAAQLIAYGARQQEIIQHIYKTKQLSQLKLWGRVLSKIQTDEKYKIVWSTVTEQDFKDTESKEDETGDIIDELMTNAPGAEVILLLKERSDNTISGSVRTTNSAVDASAIAEMFGGGGHGQAAGFRIPDGNFQKHESEIIGKIREFQASRLGVVEDEPETQKEETPIIDVEKLLHQVQEAEKAQEAMPKPEEIEKYSKAAEVEVEPENEPEEGEVSEESVEDATEEIANFKPNLQPAKKEITYKFED